MPQVQILSPRPILTVRRKLYVREQTPLTHTAWHGKRTLSRAAERILEKMCKAKGGEPAWNLPSLQLVRKNRFTLLHGRKVSRSKKKTGDEVANSRRICSSSLMAEHQISNLIVRVRSSSGAPYAGVPE